MSKDTLPKMTKFGDSIAQWVIREITNEALEMAAKTCESKIDPEWPNDDISMQCQACADAIRDLKE